MNQPGIGGTIFTLKLDNNWWINDSNPILKIPVIKPIAVYQDIKTRDYIITVIVGDKECEIFLDNQLAEELYNFDKYEK